VGGQVLLLYNDSTNLLAEVFMAHIFISYSHKDTEYAHALAQNLQGMGFDVWIDERLDYGSQWPQELQKQLDSCSAFILIMSPRSYNSEWVQSELQRARRKMKPIFPLLLEGDEPWLSVESTQYYDVRGELYPDTKFYTALKNVMSSTPVGKTLKMPKEAGKTKLTNPSQLNTGILITILGVMLLAFIGLAVFLVPRILERPGDPTAAVSGPSGGEPVSNEPTSVPQASEQPAAVDTGDPEMVLIPAGEFTMGGNAEDELTFCLEVFESNCELNWFTHEEPVHDVTLDAFYMDVYEVTNTLYKLCVDQGGCDPPQSSGSQNHADYYDNPQFDYYPVIEVDWYQARTYCEWRGARLPTEAEWEKAARGTDGRMFPWGEGLDETLANFHWNVGDTAEAGNYENGKSPYGLYDMAGNVWEWVNSLYMPYPYSPDDGRESPDSDGPRVARGGSWGFDGDNSVSTFYRIDYDPTSTSIDRGFRCAMDANP
jgi:formylglycine-generating enzyme required for sulfatase activity